MTTKCPTCGAAPSLEYVPSGLPYLPSRCVNGHDYHYCGWHYCLVPGERPASLARGAYSCGREKPTAIKLHVTAQSVAVKRSVRKHKSSGDELYQSKNIEATREGY